MNIVTSQNLEKYQKGPSCMGKGATIEIIAERNLILIKDIICQWDILLS